MDVERGGEKKVETVEVTDADGKMQKQNASNLGNMEAVLEQENVCGLEIKEISRSKQTKKEKNEWRITLKVEVK